MESILSILLMFCSNLPLFIHNTKDLNSYMHTTKEVVKVASHFTIATLGAYKIYSLLKKESPQNSNAANKPAEALYKTITPGTIKESFASIAGNEQAKSELDDVVAYFKNKKAFDKIGAKPPKGILLCGPSGTGKTLLARALAGEANCSFIAVSGSEFDLVYEGAGVILIKELFASARKTNGPCIIFIDEIDALLPSRNNQGTTSGGKVQTINEFLTQLDGFTAHEHPIIVVGATNRAESMDSAALRPGRFDRIVHVGLPNVDDREKILKLHAQKIKHDETINIRSIAERSNGFAGAHLANIINEAAFIALKNQRTYVTQDDLNTAHKKMIEHVKQTQTDTANKNAYSAIAAGTIRESFASIAGNEQAKGELDDVVAYFKNKKAFDEIGAKLPKGILLCGPSGTGKTLLARALAGEANCSFIAVAGSEFDERYVGVGAARVRQLFEAARATNEPCLIFIDEIDALLPSRNGHAGETGGHVQTINEFLTQLDGFVPHEHPIMIIGATNRAQSIDSAALRPGRFDRIIDVTLPNVDDREKILKLHAQKIKHEETINIRSIAEKAHGLAGAHLANIVNESAFIALKNKRTRVTQDDLEAALDKIIQSETLYKFKQKIA